MKRYAVRGTRYAVRGVRCEAGGHASLASHEGREKLNADR